MTKQQILDELLAAHNPELAKQDVSMISQVWEDGEHTCQKCGSLLWQRTLHMFSPGLAYPELTEFLRSRLPCKMGNHSYVFLTSEDAERLAAAINRWKLSDDLSPEFTFTSSS